MTTITPPPSRPGRTPQSSRGPGGEPTLTHKVAWRIAALGFIGLVLVGILLVRLWFLQVIGSERYVERADVNRLREVVIEPKRGTITDREGTVLVGNKPSTDVVARPRELTGERRERVLRRLAPLVGVPYAELDAAVEAGENTPYQSVTIATNIDAKLAIALRERPRQFPGISLTESYVRDYRQTPDGQPHAAHVLGFTGAITEESIGKYRDEGYLGNERVGVSGVESQYEAFLRGAPGEVKVEVNAAGEPVGRGIVSSVAPMPGSNVETTIDLGTQRALEQALREGVALNGLAEGAAGVALDPRTGEVLAMASYPGFDPSAYTENRPKDIARLNKDELRPLFDRVS
jgi:penicillin-binding protein 2